MKLRCFGTHDAPIIVLFFQINWFHAWGESSLDLSCDASQTECVMLGINVPTEISQASTGKVAELNEWDLFYAQLDLLCENVEDIDILMYTHRTMAWPIQFITNKLATAVFMLKQLIHNALVVTCSKSSECLIKKVVSI